ncbi:hypothetical protein D9611_000706 [Ephemerocybe angulata]|uniref:Uncharacterized protein n=1 Tax=Ephemerocybe angulata TaxID=980116 RepID=A0A8H5BNH3_9AGAR|nr:hypothetical protein D9611_000706 [Tulosesus angulatus]
MPASNKFPDIPEDVTRLIFEIAAEDRAHRLVYPLVSKRVRSWAEPVIYREVVVDTTYRFIHTINNQASSKPENFFALHVKSLFFDNIPPHFIAPIVEKCSSVLSLTIWSTGYTLPEPNMLMGLTGSAPRRLSLTVSAIALQERHFSHPIFQEVTHLDIFCVDRDEEMAWATLKGLKNLTHLSVQSHPGEQHQQILRGIPAGLHVVVLYVSSEVQDDTKSVIKAIDAGQADERAVICLLWMASPPSYREILRHAIMPESSVMEKWREFWDPFTTTHFLWNEAEEVLEKRRKLKDNRRE